MLIDWVTVRLPMEKIERSLWDSLRQLGERIMRYCPRTGETIWESAAWDSVRSDSHQLAFRVGSDAIWIQGSPARCIGSGDTVFGEGAALAFDLSACVVRMAAYISGQIAIDINRPAADWIVSRVDVTGNLLLNDLADVRVALRLLRECEGGRYRVSQQSGDTVYWSHRSRLRSGKAYAKGPHIEYSEKQRGYTGRQYTIEEKALINRLLRLELRLGGQWFRERVGKPWYELSADDLRNEWHEYFGRMIGSSEMNDEGQLKNRIYEAAEMIRVEENRTRKVPYASSDGMARAAYGCFLMIQSQGWEKAREGFSKVTWYRHLKVLRRAGMGDMDISAGKIVPLRRKVLECQLVNTWSDIRIAA